MDLAQFLRPEGFQDQYKVLLVIMHKCSLCMVGIMPLSKNLAVPQHARFTSLSSFLVLQVNQQSLGVQRSARSLEPSMLRSQQQHSSATTLHALHLHPLNAGAQGRGAAGMSFAAVARGASGMPPLGRQSVGNSTTPRQENGTTPRQSLDRMSVSSVVSAPAWSVRRCPCNKLS